MKCQIILEVNEEVPKNFFLHKNRTLKAAKVQTQRRSDITLDKSNKGYGVQVSFQELERFLFGWF